MTPTLIVTRPAAQGACFAAKIAQLWDGPLQVIQSPVIEIVPLSMDFTDVDEVIFTSANGVTAALDLPTGMRAWCVGERTAQAASEAGFIPTTGTGDAAGLVEMIIKARPAGRLAHIRGKYARGNVSVQLNAAGLCCQDVVAYDQRGLPLSDQARSAARADNPVIFPLFSPRTSTILNGSGPFGPHVHIVALSQAVADAFDPTLAARIVVASAPDGNAMQDAVLKVLTDLSEGSHEPPHA